MSLRSGTITKKPTSPLDKVIKKNPKYEHIGPTLDTGTTAKKQFELQDELPEHPTAGEIFKRIRPGTVTRLVFEEDETLDPTMSFLSPSSERVTHAPKEAEHIPEDISEARHRQLSGSAASSLIESQFSPESSTPLSTSSSQSTHPTALLPTSSFLLLDVRTDDEYEDCHIRYARHYPAIMLTRTINSFTPEILAFQNKEGKRIIVYCNDERESIRVASTMVQRGIDNVFVVNGGLRKMCQKYPEALDGPKPPFPPDKKLMQQRMMMGSTTASISTTATSRMSLVSSASTAKYLQNRLGPGAAGGKYAPSASSRAAGSAGMSQRSPVPSAPKAKSSAKQTAKKPSSAPMQQRE
ncbi:putative centrosomal protein of 41 kDa A [Monocercomonoides exilis]|uniref:putative centrosomal protein of 41 kDa A n=1 Tax=Monocercomonoides exilis TaxID=2049356 RepID=UPI003559F8CC|nr:putative centrosomal protein of 41 kDa A [Monocercomonoides exilis]|eukprot:MONOS_3043.1-p1 / transcript=MONOS_3043.1 / gene=MONOS_3043 / organism=Monocercomonoides_exilis_PA203 / gene_product=centrosomal protein of 41 kDa A / transcript_product=centrosomal protein of 41 kDa A / location=Mono_scaffold00067:145091-146412(+) / protein_length=352 / sequence_SO=supercontig / SO=protein_coding / is_pseudo=false